MIRSSLRFTSLFIAFVMLAVTAIPTYAGGKFKDAKYVMPSPDGKKAQEKEGMLVSDSTKREVFFESKEATLLKVPFSRIKSMLYEKTSKPRYGVGLLLAWPLLFTKSKKHYVTFQYTEASGAGKFAIVRLDKENFMVALNTLEADTGLKVERTEEH